MAVVCLIVETEDSTEVLERSWDKSVNETAILWKMLTEFQMLLRTGHELGYPHREAFG